MIQLLLLLSSIQNQKQRDDHINLGSTLNTQLKLQLSARLVCPEHHSFDAGINRNLSPEVLS
jgi:hypothetical protein